MVLLSAIFILNQKNGDCKMQVRELFKVLRTHYGLNNNECVLYYEVYCLYFFGGKNACYAANDYFESELGISSGTVKRAFKHFQQIGLLKIHYETVSGCLTKRNLYPLHDIILTEQAEEIKNDREILERERPHEDHNEEQKEPRTQIILTKNEVQNVPPIIDINLKSLNLKDKYTADLDDLRVNASVDSCSKSMINKWNEIAKKFNLASITTLTPMRKKHLLKRIQEAGGEEMFFKIIENAIKSSEFLRGRNSKHWKASFDFFLRQSSFVKSAEGAYNTRSKISPVVKAVTGEDDEISNDDLFKEFNFNN